VQKSIEYYMKAAIRRAKTAAKYDEIPVGAVIVHKGKIISGGRNRRETAKCALCHAEISAIESACKKLSGWRLFECDMYVTLEPCPMCAGAIINSRIKTLIFGAYDLRAGSIDSVVSLCDLPYNHKVEVYGGIMEDECLSIIKPFFENLRKSN
jgi:tRNA(adenine34) deaminase